MSAKTSKVFNHLPFALIYDRRLSAKAKGIWFYMKAKPYDWHFSATRMADEMTDGKKSIQGGIRELENLGYLKKQKLDSGRMRYEFFEEQFGQPAPYEGDYINETGQCGPIVWDDGAPTWSSKTEDAHCSESALTEHLEFALSLPFETAKAEAFEWAKACSEGKLAKSWRMADSWIQHVAEKYPKSQSAQKAPISSNTISYCEEAVEVAS